MKKAGKENKEIEKTIDELNTMNLSEEERIMYEEREKAIINYNFGMASAERHGKEEGLKEGLKEGEENWNNRKHAKTKNRWWNNKKISQHNRWRISKIQKKIHV